MKTRDIIQAKGQEVHAISPAAMLDEVVQTLVRHTCGSLLVMEEETLVGIITERDILRTVAGDARDLAEINVAEKMSAELVTSSLDDELGEVMSVLTENRIRHLPVVDEGELRGIISIGDVVKSQQRSLARENAFLRNYIHG